MRKAVGSPAGKYHPRNPRDFVEGDHPARPRKRESLELLQQHRSPIKDYEPNEVEREVSGTQDPHDGIAEHHLSRRNAALRRVGGCAVHLRFLQVFKSFFARQSGHELVNRKETNRNYHRRPPEAPPPHADANSIRAEFAKSHDVTAEDRDKSRTNRM